MPQRIGIVGGGLIGLFTAHALAAKGHEVTVFDRAGVGSGAARRNGGWVCPGRVKPLPSPSELRLGMGSMLRPESPMRLRPVFLLKNSGFFARFARNSTAARHESGARALDAFNRSTHALFERITASAGVAAPDGTGYLTVADDEEFIQRSRAGVVARHRAGRTEHPGPVLSRAELLRIEPQLGEQARFGYVAHGDKWLDPNALVDGIVDVLLDQGVEIRTDDPVFAIDPDQERVTLVAASGADAFDHVVVAAGAWSPGLLAHLGLRVPLLPGKGYSFEVKPTEPLNHLVVLGSTHIGATPIGDRIKIVGSIDFDGDMDSIDLDRVRMMARAAQPFFTGIDWEDLQHVWAGPRPMTPDGLPLIGRLTGTSRRVIVATGHNMVGLSLGPATAELIARMVEDDEAAPPALSPARFALRSKR